MYKTTKKDMDDPVDKMWDEDLDIVKEKYMELIMSVSKKFPGETRHETALRYILERENQCSMDMDKQGEFHLCNKRYSV